MLTIGLISPMAAGKGTAASYLVEKYGAKQYRFSGPINEILDRLHIPNARENQIKIGSTMREQFGNGIWAEILKKDILTENPAIAVIDGIRYPEDYEAVKSLPNFILIGIETDADIRFERMRARNDRPGEAEMDRATFDAQHESATEKNIATVMSHADIILNNNGSVAEFEKKIDEIVQQHAK